MATKKDEREEANEVAKATAENAAEAEAQKLDETVTGGRYEVDGKIVNANGEEIKEKK